MGRIFFATDIHGSEKCLLKFINAAAFYKAQVLVMGGDITGKMLVPIVKEGSGAVATFMGRTWHADTEKELAELMKNIRYSGGYPYVCTQEEYDYLAADADARIRVFTKVMVSELARLVDYAEEKLKQSRTQCYISPGNDDNMAIDVVFEGREWMVNPEGQVIDIDENHQMISCGYANLTPWECPRDVPEETLREKIEAMAKQLKHPQSIIFNFHCPPYGSELDEAPEVSKDLKPVLVGGQLHMIHVGCTAVREALEYWQPLVGLHGHIHEASGFTWIGRTACFNPGSEYTTGYLRGLILDLDRDNIKQYQFTYG